VRLCDTLDSYSSALAHDVGRTELTRELLARVVDASSQ
jgi:hypothetical protein